MLLLAFAAHYQAGCAQGDERWHQLAFVLTGASAILLSRLMAWRGSWKLVALGLALGAFLLGGLAGQQLEALGAQSCVWRR